MAATIRQPPPQASMHCINAPSKYSFHLFFFFTLPPACDDNSHLPPAAPRQSPSLQVSMRTRLVSFISFYCFFFTPETLQCCDNSGSGGSHATTSVRQHAYMGHTQVSTPSCPQQASFSFSLHSSVAVTTMTTVAITSTGTQPHGSARATNPPHQLQR